MDEKDFEKKSTKKVTTIVGIIIRWILLFENYQKTREDICKGNR